MNEALGDLRAALGGNDIERIKTAHEKLAQASQKAGSSLYNQQSAAGDAGPGAGDPGAQAGPGATAGAGAGAGAAGATGGTEDVVDAEIIDEDNKK
jgi:molecular chaperone DnaK